MREYLKNIIREVYEIRISHIEEMEQKHFESLQRFEALLKEIANRISHVEDELESARNALRGSELETQISDEPIRTGLSSWPRMRRHLEQEDLRSMKNQFNAEADQVAAYWAAKQRISKIDGGTAQQETKPQER